MRVGGERGSREKRGQRERGEGEREMERKREICGEWGPIIHSRHLTQLAASSPSSLEDVRSGSCWSPEPLEGFPHLTL